MHVVFGHVVSGHDLVRQLEQLPVDRNSRPLQDATISNCGELVRLLKGELCGSVQQLNIYNRNVCNLVKKDKKKKKKSRNANSDSEASNTDGERSKKRSKDKKKKSKKSKNGK